MVESDATGLLLSGFGLPFAGLVEHFAVCMRDQRGLSEVTIRHRCWHAQRFLNWLEGQNRSLGEVSFQELDAFLSLQAAQGWGRVSVATCAKALRSFFRHAEAHTWCAKGLAAGIDGPRVFKEEGLPMGPTWPDVERLLTSTRGDRPGEIRDHAILLLFALYAFRSGEVAALELGDLHWHRELIVVARPKQRRAQQYPLVRTVGEAILRYLRQVRPRCARRELFLTLKAPFRPLSAGSLYHVVSSRLSQLNIQSLRHGPHSLRHACARHLLAEGFSLKEIGDHPRTPQRLCHPNLRQSRFSRTARGRQLRPRRPGMKLAQVVGQYVTHKQSMGMRFCTEERTLKAFCRAIGNIAMTEIQRDRVDAYLAGKGPVTRFWQRKYEVVVGFYRFAIARGYALDIPLPHRVPKPARAFVPHIYSHDELRRLLKATAACDNPHSRIDSETCRTLILLLYGAGLRISEALALTLADVDLSSAMLLIHTSKFYKTRLVPLGLDLTRVLKAYATWRAMQHPSGLEGPFFVSRTGAPLTRRAAEYTFSRLRLRAGVLRHDGARYQPRLHDLRHAFSVHRLLAWYRQGADIQRLLPQLATYLGHVHLAATQRYLTMTPELLQEACQRFERYAGEVARG